MILGGFVWISWIPGARGRTSCGGIRKAVIWEAWGLYFDILGVQLGTLGHHFDDPEVPRDAQQDTLESRPGFWWMTGSAGTAVDVLVTCFS